MSMYNVVRVSYNSKEDWINGVNPTGYIILNYEPLTLREAYIFRSKQMNPIDYNFTYYFTDFIKETD